MQTAHCSEAGKSATSSHAQEVYTLSSASPFSSSFTEGVVHANVLDGFSDVGDGDVRRIAREIFTAEVKDLITVLRNCGGLRTKADCYWCLSELWRFLRPGE